MALFRQMTQFKEHGIFISKGNAGDSVQTYEPAFKRHFFISKRNADNSVQIDYPALRRWLLFILKDYAGYSVQRDDSALRRLCFLFQRVIQVTLFRQMVLL